MKSKFWVCGNLINNVLDRINVIVSSIDVSDEHKPFSSVLEDTQIIGFSLIIRLDM